jgi:hypothetical protein
VCSLVDGAVVTMCRVGVRLDQYTRYGSVVPEQPLGFVQYCMVWLPELALQQTFPPPYASHSAALLQGRNCVLVGQFAGASHEQGPAHVGNLQQMFGLQFESLAQSEPMGRPVGPPPLEPPVPVGFAPPLLGPAPPLPELFPPSPGLPPLPELRPPFEGLVPPFDEPPAEVLVPPVVDCAPPALGLPPAAEPELPPTPNMSSPPVPLELGLSVSSLHPMRDSGAARTSARRIRDMVTCSFDVRARPRQPITARNSLPLREPPTQLLDIALKRVAVRVPKV